MDNSRREEIVKAFLTYAFQDIDFKYEDLTPREQELCSKDEFERLAVWVRG